MRVCKNCKTTRFHKVHVSPFCYFGYYECTCGMVGILPDITEWKEDDKEGLKKPFAQILIKA